MAYDKRNTKRFLYNGPKSKYDESDGAETWNYSKPRYNEQKVEGNLDFQSVWNIQNSITITSQPPVQSTGSNLKIGKNNYSRYNPRDNELRNISQPSAHSNDASQGKKWGGNIYKYSGNGQDSKDNNHSDVKASFNERSNAYSTRRVLPSNTSYLQSSKHNYQ